jgi:hypothetical protein
MSVVNFTHRPPQLWKEPGLEVSAEKNPLFPTGIRTPDRPARHLVTIPTTLSRPLHVLKRQLHVTANLQHINFVTRLILQYVDYC